jgi:hypothetical protein
MLDWSTGGLEAFVVEALGVVVVEVVVTGGVALGSVDSVEDSDVAD